MPVDRAPEPWRSFLTDIDELTPASIDLRCIGGFAVKMHDSLERVTGDIDAFEVVPNHMASWLQSIAGSGSDLHRKHGIYLQIAPVAVLR